MAGLYNFGKFVKEKNFLPKKETISKTRNIAKEHEHHFFKIQCMVTLGPVHVEMFSFDKCSLVVCPTQYVLMEI